MRELIITIIVLAVSWAILKAAVSVIAYIVTAIDMRRTKKYDCLVTPNQVIVSMWFLWLFVGLVCLCTFIYFHLKGNETATWGLVNFGIIFSFIAVIGILYYYSSMVYVVGTVIYCNRFIIRKRASISELSAVEDKNGDLQIQYLNGKKFTTILSHSEGYDNIVAVLKGYDVL